MSSTDSTADSIAALTSVYSSYADLLGAEAHGLGGSMLLAGAGSAVDHAAVEPLMRAANIAGAASLLLCDDGGAARERVRSGVCDFMVTTLDEALRILKNELRRKQAASVCLPAEPLAVLAECVERGVQPDLFAWFDSEPPEQAALFAERGALMVPSAREAAEVDLPDGRRMTSWSVSVRAAMPVLNELALSRLGLWQHAERQRWLSRSPQYLARDLRLHGVPMDKAEAALLAGAVSLAIEERQLPGNVALHFGAEPLLY